VDSGPGRPEERDEDRPDERDEDRPDLLGRLDPDRGRTAREDRVLGDAAAGKAPGSLEDPGDPRRPAMVTLSSGASVDTRRYRWMIGIIGLIVVVIFSVYLFATRGLGGTGVPPGQRLRYFAAPLAATTLTGSPNISPPCTLARHDPRALNICLLVKRGPLVLSLFVVGAAQCERQVDALQQLSRRFARSGVQFVAVAVNGDRASTRRAIRAHHWTIPVAYDDDGAVQGLYGVAACPMAELAARGGIVRDRLIGDSWASSRALAPRVQALLASRQ
jgi:peroxiredoxin